jgi:hypothetical protein
MGGPAAWKEMQKKKGGWNSEGFEARINDDNGDGDNGEKRDRYQEYDVEVDKLNDTDEEASDENVRPIPPLRWRFDCSQGRTPS